PFEHRTGGARSKEGRGGWRDRTGGAHGSGAGGVGGADRRERGRARRLRAAWGARGGEVGAGTCDRAGRGGRGADAIADLQPGFPLSRHEGRGRLAPRPLSSRGPGRRLGAGLARARLGRRHRADRVAGAGRGAPAAGPLGCLYRDDDGFGRGPLEAAGSGRAPRRRARAPGPRRRRMRIGACMKPYLAIDTSTALGSVAVGRGSELLAEIVVGVSTKHSESLLPAIDYALRSAGLEPPDLGAVVVAGGPGSFTGVRVAGATAKGFVRALGVPLFAYSGLLALAAAVAAEGPVCALFDARRGEVYAGCWRFPGDGAVEVIMPPTAAPV